MNAHLQSRLNTLDSTLTTLIDSLTSLNPSLPAAQSLLTADADLQASVKQLSRHQANYSRISSIHTQIASLNASITERLTSLAALRSEILAQDVRPVKGEGVEEGRQVKAGELLEYAQRISRFTVPPTYRPRAKQAQGEKKDGKETGILRENAAMNGVSGEAGEEVGERILEGADMGGWVPWPSEEVIRQGPLGQLQALMEQGVDPAAVPVEQGTEKGEAMEGVLKEEGIDKEVQNGRVNERVVERESARGREVQRDEKPKVFGGLDLYNPDEE